MKLASLLIILALTLTNLSSSGQSCDLKCPDNVIVAAELGREGAYVNFEKTTFPSLCGSVTYTPASGGFFRLGSHSIIVQTSTGKRCSFTVTVTDNEPPVLSELSFTRNEIWPASNKFKKVGVSYSIKDNGEDVKTVMTITSNSPDAIKDWEMVDDHMVKLKASRLPDGTARVYTISVTATDDAGNKTTRSKTISVSQPLSMKSN